MSLRSSSTPAVPPATGENPVRRRGVGLVRLQYDGLGNVTRRVWRKPNGGLVRQQDFTWDAFYDDPEAKQVLWHTLVRISASFKRYELRKDWFIKLMQYRPTTVSLASNAFMTREHDPSEEPIHFGEREFCIFFHALFDPLQNLSPRDDAAFRKEFGSDPHHLIGEFLVNLSMCLT